MKKIFLFVLTFLIFCTAGQAKIIDLHNCYIKDYNKTYNLGSGKSLSIGSIINLLIKGLAENPQEYPIEYEQNTLGDPFETLADMSKIKTDLNWSPKLMPEEGIQKIIELYREKK